MKNQWLSDKLMEKIIEINIYSLSKGKQCMI